MLEYRAYLVDKHGRICRRVDLICTDEDGARARAKLLVDGHDVELWHGTTKIATFHHLNGYVDLHQHGR
ncbi:hypothetical protein [Bradyrhizobium sp. OAE829]|uniref:hypothetical protein n=1 Tax=Bradyrhizobium sp. OAE829 TaxID=2663807 RepID=UPI001788F743